MLYIEIKKTPEGVYSIVKAIVVNIIPTVNPINKASKS